MTLSLILKNSPLYRNGWDWFCCSLSTSITKKTSGAPLILTLDKEVEVISFQWKNVIVILILAGLLRGKHKCYQYYLCQAFICLQYEYVWASEHLSFWDIFNLQQRDVTFSPRQLVGQLQHSSLLLAAVLKLLNGS